MESQAYIYTKQLEFSPDGKLMISIEDDAVIKGIERRNKSFKIWNPATEESPVTIQLDDEWHRPYTMLSPDNTRIACIWPSKIQVLDAVTGSCLWTSRAYKSDLGSGTFFSTDGSPNGTEIATMGGTGKYISSHPPCIHIWDIATGQWKSSVALQPKPFSRPMMTLSFGPIHATFSPDGGHIAYVEDHGSIYICDVATGEMVKALPGFFNTEKARGTCGIWWGGDGLVTQRGIYATQALLNDHRSVINYGSDNIPAGALSGIGLSLEEDWILKNNERYLWIPPAVQMQVPSLATSDNTIVLAGDNGGVYYIRFP
ncbi:hypothetical protein F5X97DRAFT_315251 [Nemania serpens]|nr:hypothetical protein F5X97DRAFT_315251 [Nemania serpens]